MRRRVNLGALLQESSYFLLGPRGTGKSYLIEESLAGRARIIDLLNAKVYRDLQRDPHLLETMVDRDWVVIDEVQRVPELLNEVHRLIEKKGTRFLLTGSSARSLRRRGTNLLAGRAFQARLFPLTWVELENENAFELERYLRLGGLPMAYLKPKTAHRYLYAYVDTYLREEIQAEAQVRQIGDYSRFLEAAAHAQGQLLNFAKIANDAQVSANTVRAYYQLLEDTLLGFQLPAWTGSQKRKAISRAKFYFFDVGIARALLGVESLERASDLYGLAFEHFIAMELRAYLSYTAKRTPLRYWRSKNQHEVDFLLGDVAIEVKASSRVSERDHRGLRALLEEGPREHALLVSQDETKKNFSTGVTHIYWEAFLENLWSGVYG